MDGFNLDDEEYQPYCKNCNSCGEEGCCSPFNCFSTLFKDEKCKYGEKYLLDIKFSEELNDKLTELIHDTNDQELINKYHQIFSELFDKIYIK